jgi:hypothetical protein
MTPDDTNRSERCIGNLARCSPDLSFSTYHPCHITKTRHNFAPAIFRRTLQSETPSLERGPSDPALSRTFYRILEVALRDVCGRCRLISAVEEAWSCSPYFSRNRQLWGAIDAGRSCLLTQTYIFVNYYLLDFHNHN